MKFAYLLAAVTFTNASENKSQISATLETLKRGKGHERHENEEERHRSPSFCEAFKAYLEADGEDDIEQDVAAIFGTYDLPLEEPKGYLTCEEFCNVLVHELGLEDHDHEDGKELFE